MKWLVFTIVLLASGSAQASCVDDCKNDVIGDVLSAFKKTEENAPPGWAKTPSLRPKNYFGWSPQNIPYMTVEERDAYEQWAIKKYAGKPYEIREPKGRP